MSRTFTDESLRVWEAYPSGGPFGLAENPKIVFHCLSDSGSRARFVELRGEDEADAEGTVATADDDGLRAMLARSTELG